MKALFLDAPGKLRFGTFEETDEEANSSNDSNTSPHELNQMLENVDFYGDLRYLALTGNPGASISRAGSCV